MKKYVNVYLLTWCLWELLHHVVLQIRIIAADIRILFAVRMWSRTKTACWLAINYQLPFTGLRTYELVRISRTSIDLWRHLTVL